MYPSKSKVVAKHTNTGQVVGLSQDDDIGTNNAPAISFYDSPVYREDPETGESYLERAGAWFTVVHAPTPGVIRRWNAMDQEDLPRIPYDLAGPAVMEHFHSHGKRMKICCSCGTHHHPSATGTVSMFPHLSHVIVFAGQYFKEPG